MFRVSATCHALLIELHIHFASSAIRPSAAVAMTWEESESSLTCGGPRVTTAQNETLITVSARRVDWGEARDPEAGSKVPDDKDPDSDRKRKFRDITRPSLPTLGSWWELVEQDVTWINKQNHHLQSCSCIHTISCSDKRNQVNALAGFTSRLPQLWQRR